MSIIWEISQIVNLTGRKIEMGLFKKNNEWGDMTSYLTHFMMSVFKKTLDFNIFENR